MKKRDAVWLEHLEEAVPPEGYGNKLSMYLIALEAWRRGIQVNFFTIDNPDNKLLIRYALEYKGDVHRFESSLGDKLSSEAYDVCEYKDLTKRYLSDAGIKVPRGKVFPASAEETELIEYVNSISFPVVVKPLNENAGKGVFSNVDSEEKLFDVVKYLRDDLHYRNLLIEEYIPGTEYRVLTVDGKVEGVVNRIPANIIGNGKDTIADLIKKKNRSKYMNPAISKKRISLDKEVLQTIENEGYTQESILEKDQKLFLRAKSNISAGGDPIDIMDDVSEEIINMAEKATQAIPGLNVAGLDFIVDPETGKATVIEINTKPMIGLHVFPEGGKARDVVKPIVDLYFPETKDVERGNLYFDFKSKIAPLDNLTVKEVSVSPLEKTKVYSTREYIIETENPETELQKGIRLEALKKGIHGFVTKHDSNHYQVVAAGSTLDVLGEFKSYLTSENSIASILNVEEREWTKPVNVNFTVRRENVKPLEEKLKAQKNENSKLWNNLRHAEEELRKSEKKLVQKEEEMVLLSKDLNRVRKENRTLEAKELKSTIRIGELERAHISSERLLAEDLKTLKADYNELLKKHKDTLNSKSWKITKPLRKYNPKAGKRNKK